MKGCSNCRDADAKQCISRLHQDLSGLVEKVKLQFSRRLRGEIWAGLEECGARMLIAGSEVPQGLEQTRAWNNPGNPVRCQHNATCFFEMVGQMLKHRRIQNDPEWLKVCFIYV